MDEFGHSKVQTAYDKQFVRSYYVKKIKFVKIWLRKMNKAFYTNTWVSYIPSVHIEKIGLFTTRPLRLFFYTNKLGHRKKFWRCSPSFDE